MDKEEKILRNSIRNNIRQIFSLRKIKRKFIPGKTLIQYAGGVFDDKEIIAMTDSAIDGWFGLGEKAQKLEEILSKFLGTKGSILTNSGSSSNLLAVASLCSPLITDHLKPGDEVITCACGYPTTINPLIVYGLQPVLIDINPETYNIDAKNLEKAITKKTRLVMLAHTLGNPNEIDEIVKFCQEHNLFLIEDNCDALGSVYDGKKTGSFGVLSTQSFYPPHHLTMGEGGAVNYNEIRFERITRSLRDWGRGCWCRGDEKNRNGACRQRFNFKIRGHPYDHKYVFTQIGYNLKPIEPQAAMGLEQFKKLPDFIKKRGKNFARLYRYAREWQDFFILPKSLPKSKPCWFTFPFTIKNGVKFSRYEITTYLEEKKIQTRPLFAGNFTRQPAYANCSFKTIGNLENADRAFFNTFFVGIYPGLGNEEIDYIAQNINDFLSHFK